jgi:NADH:ubiquinone oxidoreductase subunit 6 (subunit J)
MATDPKKKTETDESGARKRWVAATVVLLLLLAAGIVAVGFLSGEPNIKFQDAAAALTIIGAIAVGIERMTETMWAAADVVLNAGWPNKSVAVRARKLTAQLDEQLAPFLKEAEKAVSVVSGATGSAAGLVDPAAAKLGELKSSIAALKAQATSDAGFHKVALTTLTGIESLQSLYPNLKEAAGTAQIAVNEAAEFVGTFRDNPGRRLISVYVGVLLGLVAAAVTGLDVFQATMETAAGGQSVFHGGVALTGVLMGLGASPTHEVIEILKTVKRSRQATASA